MHELAIAESVVEAILERTEQRQVTTVRLAVGRLSGVVPDALEFCFELATAGTPLEGATLEIVEPSGRAHCRGCDREFEKDDLILLCEWEVPMSRWWPGASCRSPQWRWLSVRNLWMR